MPAADPAGRRLPIGRREDSTPWLLHALGRHTLVVGASGAGKGSVLWGTLLALAPMVRAGRLVVLGIDLKGGVELHMGRSMMSATAYTSTEALALLRHLVTICDERAEVMRGVTRDHAPTTDAPAYLLVVDELASLVAYCDRETRTEAERLLGRILSTGRALGVCVLACVQDPRREVVAQRGLFTQTIALRLRSEGETEMVLGDGAARLVAPHRISPAAQGLAYVVQDDGVIERVRADYVPDSLIRSTAATHGTPVVVEVPTVPSASAPRRSRRTTNPEEMAA